MESERYTVLVVDDEEDIRQLLADRLEATGLKVLTARDGQEGLRMIVEKKPDAVFLDLNMPGKDGMSVLRELKARDIKQAVVVVTANPTIDYAIEAMKLGAYDFIIKPFDAEHLQIVCEKVLESQRLRREAALWQDCARRYLHQMYPAEIADALVQGNLAPCHIECSVLFTDTVGFTKFAAVHTPEETAAELTACFSLIHEIVRNTGGWVDNFLGDGMMVVFGVPFGSPTHAEDAVRAAIAIQQAVRTSPSGLRQHVSINSGVALAGDVGSRQKPHYTVIGEVVNIAGRLLRIARPGEILVGEATKRLLHTAIRTECVGPLDVKGMGDLHIHRVLYDSPG